MYIVKIILTLRQNISCRLFGLGFNHIFPTVVWLEILMKGIFRTERRSSPSLQLTARFYNSVCFQTMLQLEIEIQVMKKSSHR